jgi:hypothetical protein
MNSRDRKALTPVLAALRKLHKPINPADIRGIVARLDEAISVARTAAVVIESCGYGEYDLANEESEEIGTNG